MISSAKSLLGLFKSNGSAEIFTVDDVKNLFVAFGGPKLAYESRREPLKFYSLKFLVDRLSETFNTSDYLRIELSELAEILDVNDNATCLMNVLSGCPEIPQSSDGSAILTLRHVKIAREQLSYSELLRTRAWSSRDICDRYEFDLSWFTDYFTDQLTLSASDITVRVWNIDNFSDSSLLTYVYSEKFYETFTRTLQRKIDEADKSESTVTWFEKDTGFAGFHPHVFKEIVLNLCHSNGSIQVNDSLSSISYQPHSQLIGEITHRLDKLHIGEVCYLNVNELIHNYPQVFTEQGQVLSFYAKWISDTNAPLYESGYLVSDSWINKAAQNILDELKCSKFVYMEVWLSDISRPNPKEFVYETLIHVVKSSLGTENLRVWENFLVLQDFDAVICSTVKQTTQEIAIDIAKRVHKCPSFTLNELAIFNETFDFNDSTIVQKLINSNAQVNHLEKLFAECYSEFAREEFINCMAQASAKLLDQFTEQFCRFVLAIWLLHYNSTFRWMIDSGNGDKEAYNIACKLAESLKSYMLEEIILPMFPGEKFFATPGTSLPKYSAFTGTIHQGINRFLQAIKKCESMQDAVSSLKLLHTAMGKLCQIWQRGITREEKAILASQAEVNYLDRVGKQAILLKEKWEEKDTTTGPLLLLSACIVAFKNVMREDTNIQKSNEDGEAEGEGIVYLTGKNIPKFVKFLKARLKSEQLYDELVRWKDKTVKGTLSKVDITEMGDFVEKSANDLMEFERRRQRGVGMLKKA